MSSYCDGDAGAFRALYAAFAPKLHSYLCSVLPDPVTAEDLVQRTFLKLHIARSSYIRGADPTPWLYAIAHRACIDELRRRRRAWVRLMDDGERDLPEIEATLAGTSVDSEEHDPCTEAKHRAILDAMRQLTDAQRDVLLLTRIQGLTAREAAQVLGTTEGAVRLRAHRAYVRLREILAGHELFGATTCGGSSLR
jgi:RNA polymerase sigma-70 factor (ECF subfamily)